MAKLAAYRAKRNFSATPEPAGSPDEGATGDGSSFVVQKHAASRLHYDLRLELDGVMKSWAVAKGPSLVPGEKRLAAHTEDHPLEYNSFEGTIPKGQYGGGTVLLWDRGHWEPEGDPHRAYAKGHLKFRLYGEKLRGGWHLVRMRPRPREKTEAWLLFKSDDEAARGPDEPDILEEAPLSVATGRSLADIAADKARPIWNSNREGKGASPAGPMPAKEGARPRQAKASIIAKANSSPPSRARAPRAKRAPASSPEAPVRDEEEVPPAAAGQARPDLKALTKGGRKAAMPDTLEPCLATLAASVPRGDRWVHEVKWDGYRLLAFKRRRRVKLLTRRGHDWTERFPSIAMAIDAMPVDDAILDGEAVVEDEAGIANFSALQNALSDEHGRVARNAILYAFDLLYLEGHDLMQLPLEQRKARLAALIPPRQAGYLRLGEHLETDGEAMLRSACQLGLEGVISKRRDRPYRPGRSDDWVKVKCTERQEFVVLGFVPSTAARRAIGSLVLGYHEGGDLRLAGRSGTGYSAAVARDLWLKLDPIKRKTPPLTQKLAADDRRNVVWTEPRLVAEVEFRGWTADDRLRHAAFKGLREDKSPEEVTRERPSAVGPGRAGDQPKAAGIVRPGTRPARTKARNEVAGVALTHPDRVLWNDGGITKQGLAEFYEEIADWILPHVAERPLSLVRCPNGVEGGCFYQKHSWAGLSDHILRKAIADEGGEDEVLYIRDIRGLIALVQAGVLEIHPWGAPIGDVDRPDRIVMDLDPGEGVTLPQVIAGARELRDRLAADGLESFVKTTGGKGLHVVVPLSGPADWPGVKAYTKGLADGMAADSPDRYLAIATKKARRGLIYVDYLRNGRGATAISAYSTRARPGAPIAVPLRWEELSPALKPNQFTVANLPARLRRLKSDPWAQLRTCQQELPQAKRTAGKRTPARSVR